MGLDAFTPTDKLRAEAAEETFVVIEDEEFREEMAVRRSLPPRHRSTDQVRQRHISKLDPAAVPPPRPAELARTTGCGPRDQG
jgi:hypothetical protein